MNIEEQTAVARNHWEFVPGPNLIKRKKGNIIFRILTTIFPFAFRYRVQAIYILTKEEWLNTELRKFSFPFDSMPIRGSFKLNNSWTIPAKDLKTLKDGPLFAEDGTTIIVPALTALEVAKQWASLWRPALIPIVVGLIYKGLGLLDWLS